LTNTVNQLILAFLSNEVAFFPGFFPLNLTRDRWDDKIEDCDAIRIIYCSELFEEIFLSEPKRIHGKQKALFNFGK